MRRMLGLCGVLTVIGCTSPPPIAAGDPRVMLTPDAGALADAPVVLFGTPLQASVRLVNPSSSDRPVIETTEWLTAAGAPVRSLLSTPQRLTVPRFGDRTVRIVAPNPGAVQFRIRIEADFSADIPS